MHVLESWMQLDYPGGGTVSDASIPGKISDSEDSQALEQAT